MASVELRFSALPAHVRTARLVAVAMARRAGLPDDVLEEVRLAVGEACSRAVELHLEHCPQEPVTVVLEDSESTFAVAVSDCVPDSHEEPRGVTRGDLEAGLLPAGVELAVITGLVDDVDVTSGEQGGTVRMGWLVPPRPVAS